MKLEELKKHVMENPPVATVGCFAVQTQAMNELGQTSYRWRTLPYSLLHDAFVRGDTNYVHEVFLDWMPVKPFWDVDMPKADYHESFLNTFIQRISRDLDFSSDREDYAIMQTLYPADVDKVSFHIVLNDGSYFQSAQMFGRYISGRNLNVDLLHIDMNVYRSSGSMRCPGSSKWVRGKPAYPLLVHGIFHKDCSYSQYTRCLAQVVPTVGGRLFRMEGFEAEVAKARRGLQMSVRRESAIGSVLAIIQQDPRNDDIDLQPTNQANVPANVEEQTSAYMSFSLDCHGYGICSHSLSCIYRPDSEVLMIRCGQGVCGDQVVGVTDFASQMLRESRYMDFLARHNLDRPDFLLTGTRRDVGYFGLTEQEFWAKVRQQIGACKDANCAFCTHPDARVPAEVCSFFVSERNPTMCSLEAFDWLKAEYPGDMRKLVTYCNFTFCIKGSKIWQRKIDQFEEVSKQDATVVFAPLMYDVWSPPTSKKAMQLYLLTGEGGKVTRKPFFEYWMKDKFTRRFDSVTQGVLDFSAGSQFNQINQLGVDMNQAVVEYEQCSDAEKNMLGAVWDAYKDMLTALEEGEVKRKAKLYVERFIFESIFRFAEMKHGNLVLMSETGGQGKTSLGDLVCMILGKNHSMSFSGDEFFAEVFNKGTNGFIQWDEAVISKKDSEKLKARMTAETISIREMRRDRQEQPNRTSFLISSNRQYLPFLSGPGMDRRVEVLAVPDIAELDELGIFSYQCMYCEADDENVCGHSFLSHSQWIQILRRHIISYSGTKEARGEKFFLPFVGMLKKLYNSRQNQYAEYYSNNLDFDKPKTSAGDKTREKCADLAVKFMTACFRRGFTSEMNDDPPRHFYNQPILFPEYQVEVYERELSDPNKVRRWTRFVSRSQLYFAFKIWCHSENVKALTHELFEADLRRYYKKLLRGPVPELSKPCLKLEYQKDNLGEYKWTPVKNPQYPDVPCFDFGAKPWDQVDVPQRNSSVPKRAALLRSASMAAISPENSLSNGPMLADTRQALMFSNANPRMGFADLYNAFADEDARDGFDPGLERTRRVREQDLSDVDEDHQDLVAAREDEQSKRRRKEVGGWLDNQAEEISQHEEDELDMMEEIMDEQEY